jgi:hypothetical protein
VPDPAATVRAEALSGASRSLAVRHGGQAPEVSDFLRATSRHLTTLPSLLDQTVKRLRQLPAECGAKTSIRRMPLYQGPQHDEAGMVATLS